MSQTDLGQPDLAALCAAARDAEFANAGTRLLSVYGYPVADAGSAGARSHTRTVADISAWLGIAVRCIRCSTLRHSAGKRPIHVREVAAACAERDPLDHSLAISSCPLLRSERPAGLAGCLARFHLLHPGEADSDRRADLPVAHPIGAQRPDVVTPHPRQHLEADTAPRLFQGVQMTTVAALTTSYVRTQRLTCNAHDGGEGRRAERATFSYSALPCLAYCVPPRRCAGPRRRSVQAALNTRPVSLNQARA